MLNLYEAVRSNPSINRLEIGDFLFAEYTCPVGEEKLAHWAPADRPARQPRWWAYPLAAVLPFLFMPLMLVLAPWLWLTPKHPPIHFPPIGSG